jgi:MOSC domain-containing protein YiiM
MTIPRQVRGRRPGVYLRIIAAGVVTTGDTIEVEPAEQPAVRISSLVENHIPQEVLLQAVEDPRVPANWRRAAARALDRATP